MICKYNIQISKELWSRYCDYLTDNFFRLLPIFEGKDFKSKQIINSPSEAFRQYNKTLDNFIIEMQGGRYLFLDEVYFIKLLTNLEGLKNITIDEHEKLKSVIFGCINLIEKMKGSG